MSAGFPSLLLTTTMLPTMRPPKPLSMRAVEYSNRVAHCSFVSKVSVADSLRCPLSAGITSVHSTHAHSTLAVVAQGEQKERDEHGRPSYHRLASFNSTSSITRSALRAPELTKVNDAAFSSRESCSGVASWVWASSRTGDGSLRTAYPTAISGTLRQRGLASARCSAGRSLRESSRNRRRE